ncbi:MAG: penicillin-binding protein 2 [Sphingomonas sp.]|nr:penicillin-binding protein 2 [Sphingomonas sp.]
MLMLVIAAGVALVLSRLIWLGLMAQGPEGRDALALVPLRGDIVDRNGAPLARTIDIWAIQVARHELANDPADLAGKLAQIMPEHDRAWYYRQLTSGPRYNYLAQRALPETVNAVNALGEPGIRFARVPERLYPQTVLAAHALGPIDASGHGVSGVERALDDQLTNPIARARPAMLSLDARVQAAVEAELGNAMTSFQAKGAAGLVLDVATGEVVAMASLPNFDPNRPPAIANPKDPFDPAALMLRNNVVQSVYELGSTFKPITMAAAIDSGVVGSMARRFDATEPLAIGGFKIKDDHPQRRYLNIPETLVHSSNIATARIADELGAERMQAMFRKLGFDTRPDITLKERGRPIWPVSWGRVATMTTAYGHGIAITPLQLASAYAALVNGGIWRPATLLRLAPGQVPAGRRVISPATSARMRQLLRLVVLKGTGKKAEAPGYRVGGKTGTAEVATKAGYAKNRNVSTFAAAFPMDAPRYVVVVMIDSPIASAASAGQTTAGWTAAPVVSRVIMRTGSMLGVTPDRNRDVDVAELMPLLWSAPGDADE